MQTDRSSLVSESRSVRMQPIATILTPAGLVSGAVAFVLATGALLTGQNVVLTGAIGGRVTDASGAVVLGATITLRNLATGVQQSRESNHAGLYQFPALITSKYSVMAEHVDSHADFRCR